MRKETKAVFEKLHKFLGKSIRHLVERSDEDYVLRLNRNRVYYVRESLMRRATNVRPISWAAGAQAYRLQPAAFPG